MLFVVLVIVHIEEGEVIALYNEVPAGAKLN
jgi:hypothetical protein